MARFDAFPHPDKLWRTTTPYLLDVQNDFISNLGSRIVIPLRTLESFGLQMRDLNPLLTIAGKTLVLDTAALAAFPASGLKKPSANLAAWRVEIESALDTVFGAF
jgi:toxin CcdB